MALSKELFDSVRGPHSGFYKSDGRVVERIDIHGGQKSWMLSEPCALPDVANKIVSNVIQHELLGDGEQVWYAPSDLRMDQALRSFQMEHAIIVPLILQQKSGDIVGVSLKRRKRAVKSQFDMLISAHTMVTRPNAEEVPVLRNSDDDDDDDVDHKVVNDDHAGKGQRGDLGNPDHPVQLELSITDSLRKKALHEQQQQYPQMHDDDSTASEPDDVDDDDNRVGGVEPDNPGQLGYLAQLGKPAKVASAVLDQTVVRRLLTTLLHDQYMRRMIDVIDLCCATYLNLHGLSEARATYNCLEIMFTDYDDDGKRHWRAAASAWSNFVTHRKKSERVAPFNELVVGGFDQLVAKAHTVHNKLNRHAKYHCRLYPRICPMAQCTVDLSNRAFSEMHTCFANNKRLIWKAKREADEE